MCRLIPRIEQSPPADGMYNHIMACHASLMSLYFMPCHQQVGDQARHKAVLDLLASPKTESHSAGECTIAGLDLVVVPAANNLLDCRPQQNGMLKLRRVTPFDIHQWGVGFDNSRTHKII